MTKKSTPCSKIRSSNPYVPLDHGPSRCWVASASQSASQLQYLGEEKREENEEKKEEKNEEKKETVYERGIHVQHECRLVLLECGDAAA